MRLKNKKTSHSFQPGQNQSTWVLFWGRLSTDKAVAKSKVCLASLFSSSMKLIVAVLLQLNMLKKERMPRLER
jgi:hypothetical protein